MSRIEEDRQAAFLAEAYRAAKDAARTVGIIDGDAAKDSAIPSDIKAALMAWATSITITLSRREGVHTPTPPPSADPIPRERVPAASKNPEKEAPVFGDSRKAERSGKMEWYAGPCEECGQPAWVRYAVGDDSNPSGTHKCLKCWMKGRPRK